MIKGNPYPSIDEFALTEEQKYYWGYEGSKMRENIKEKVEWELTLTKMARATKKGDRSRIGILLSVASRNPVHIKEKDIKL